MKKIYSLLLALVCSVGLWATEETLTLATPEGIAEITVTSQGTSSTGGDLDLSKGDVTVTSALGYFKGSGTKGIQIYKTGTMTVSVPNTHVITSVEFIYATNCYPFSQAVASGGSATTQTTSATAAAIFTPSTPASSFTFTNVAAGQTKVKTLVVTYRTSSGGSGDGGDQGGDSGDQGGDSGDQGGDSGDQGGEDGGDEDAPGILYSWDGNSSNSSANEVGGTATAQGGNASTIVGKASKLNWCLQLGKGYSSGVNYIKITLDEPLKAGDIITTGCFVTGSSRPTADLVYGINFEGANEITITYDADDEEASEIPYITANEAPADHAPIVVPAAAEGKKDIWIYRKSGSTTLYVSKFVVNRPVANISVSAAQYATYYNADHAYTMPEGLEGITVEGVNGSALTLNNTHYAAGSVVPAGEALILHGAAGNYTLLAGTTSNAKVAGNLLKGTSSADEMTTGGDKYYRLSVHGGVVGFYYGAADGAAFQPGANKAYLAVSDAAAPAHFAITDDANAVTAVENVETAETVKFMQNGQLFIKKNGVIYNAMGQVVK